MSGLGLWCRGGADIMIFREVFCVCGVGNALLFVFRESTEITFYILAKWPCDVPSEAEDEP